MPNLFSPLTSKLFGGTTILLTLALVALLVYKNGQLSTAQTTITNQTTQISSLRSDLRVCQSNSAALETELSVQSAKVQAAADAANLVAKAGVAAVAATQRAGAGVAKQVERINALPEATCADVDDILLQGAK